ncbi:hypothetical protein GJ689_12875 [Rhodoplanes serenus]|uniref:DUF5330 domain-containing protein n=1 Tax=Rhodoplanes serenus TaxID=200615 RepID=A0A3S4CK24_9BRAD|nr:DUF5330 domain-containing protein [Rhodoplanes serenus]MTW17096.1 hypothetical protein [Rhodoplanes serenus]VCU11102.1 hypothetical protein RHODGE_RHODGE_04306 [Rhodoplanes serenus]
MGFLLRTAFWLGVVAVLLPTVTRSPSDDGGQSAVSAADAASAAASTVADLRQFCTRQPDVCAVGMQVASAIGQKAQAGAKIMMEMVSETLSSSERAPVTTGAAGKLDIARPTSSQHTLSTADLVPEWRGPTPRREQAARPPG